MFGKRQPPTVLVPYADLHTATRKSVDRYISGAHYEDTSSDALSYGQTLARYWNQGSDLVVIEQDIEINEDVSRSFNRCRDSDWCVYSYQGPPHLGYLYRSLGCTRFSRKLQRKIPFDEFIPFQMLWYQVDTRISRILWDIRGIKPHVHGHVKHHKFYPQDQNWFYANEKQPDGRVFVYKNKFDGTRGKFVKELPRSDWER